MRRQIFTMWRLTKEVRKSGLPHVLFDRKHRICRGSRREPFSLVKHPQFICSVPYKLQSSFVVLAKVKR